MSSTSSLLAIAADVEVGAGPSAPDATPPSSIATSTDGDHADKKLKTETGAVDVTPAKKSLSYTEQLKKIFTHDAGYRFKINPKFLNISVSKESAKKKEEKHKKYGRTIVSTKDRFVNVNSVLPTFPMKEKILSKFVPALADRKFGTTLIGAVCKARFVRMSGMCSKNRTTYPHTDNKLVVQEFSLTMEAYREDTATDDGKDPDAKQLWDDLKEVWGAISIQIADSDTIAPNLHVKCNSLVPRPPAPTVTAATITTASTTTTTVMATTTTTATVASTSSTLEAEKAEKEKAEKEYRQRYRAMYIEKFIEPLDYKDVLSFSARLFSFPTVEQVESFKKNPYKPPVAAFHNLYYQREEEERLVFQDLPVIRPRTDEEIKADPNDTNPFAYVPFQDRDVLTDNCLFAPVYDIGVTEEYNDKSFLKLRPVCVIWFKDIQGISPLAMNLKWRQMTLEESVAKTSSSEDEAKEKEKEKEKPKSNDDNDNDDNDDIVTLEEGEEPSSPPPSQLKSSSSKHDVVYSTEELKHKPTTAKKKNTHTKNGK